MSGRERPSSITSSAAIIGGNDDLLTEILVFLPAKPLIRFKLVSKHWRSLISSHIFSHLHTLHHRRRRHHLPPEQSFLFRTDHTFEFFVCHLTAGRLIPFRFGTGFPLVCIMQSCNGLLLLECRNALNGPRHYFIFNPTTMQSINLLLPRSTFLGLCLIFDPSESPHYKVVCFVPRGDSTAYLVYHSQEHEWKAEDTVTYNFWDSFDFNNGIYFVESGYSSSSEMIQWMPTPPRISSPGEIVKYTIESNGYLHHLRLCLMRDKNRLLVYETQDISSGWPKKYPALDFNPISGTFSGNDGTAIELLGMIRGKTMDDSILLVHVPGKIMIYKFGEKGFEELVDFTRENYFQEDQLRFGFKDSHRFIYSLAPV